MAAFLSISRLFTLCPSYESSVRAGTGSGLFLAVPPVPSTVPGTLSVRSMLAEQSSKHDLLLSKETLLPRHRVIPVGRLGEVALQLPEFPALQAGSTGLQVFAITPQWWGPGK